MKNIRSSSLEPLKARKNQNEGEGKLSCPLCLEPVETERETYKITETLRCCGVVLYVLLLTDNETGIHYARLTMKQ